MFLYFALSTVNPHDLSVCQCVYWFKIICNPESILRHFHHHSEMHMYRVIKNESRDAHIPAEVEQGGDLLSHFNPPTVNLCPFLKSI